VKDPAKPTPPGWSWQTHHQRSQTPKTSQVYVKEESECDSSENLKKYSHDDGFIPCLSHHTLTLH
jgi:hypothetical protein